MEGRDRIDDKSRGLQLLRVGGEVPTRSSEVHCLVSYGSHSTAEIEGNIPDDKALLPGCIPAVPQPSEWAATKILCWAFVHGHVDGFLPLGTGFQDCMQTIVFPVPASPVTRSERAWQETCLSSEPSPTPAIPVETRLTVLRKQFVLPRFSPT